MNRKSSERIAARVTFLLGIVAISLGGCTKELEPVSRTGQLPTVPVNEFDFEMNAAIAEARRTLEDFLIELRRPGDRKFLVKAKFPTAHDSVEHIWVADIEFANGIFRGVLANEPEDIPGKKFMDPVEVERDMVSDWMIVDGEVTTGAFTTKALKKKKE